jgi:hypothetical protein
MMGEIRTWTDKTEYIAVLRKEIQVLKTRIQETDTGHIHTTISVLENRVKELEADLNWPFPA